MGLLVALWRDRTFQSISLTILMVVFSVVGTSTNLVGSAGSAAAITVGCVVVWRPACTCRLAVGRCAARACS